MGGEGGPHHHHNGGGANGNTGDKATKAVQEAKDGSLILLDKVGSDVCRE